MVKRRRLRASRGEDAAEELGQAVGLGDGESRRGLRWLEALDPAEAAHGLLDAEKGGANAVLYGLVIESGRHAKCTSPGTVKGPSGAQPD